MSSVDKTSSGAGISTPFRAAFTRSKGPVILFLVLGVLVPGVAKILGPSHPSAEAKILVRFIPQAPTSIESSDTNLVQQPPMDWSTVMNTEREIATSFEVATVAAQAVGPSNVLKAVGGGSNPRTASAWVHRNLRAEAVPDSRVLKLSLQHPYPEIAVSLLTQAVQTYLVKHSEAHRAPALLEDFLMERTAKLQDRLIRTEHELKKLHESAPGYFVAGVQEAQVQQLTRMQCELQEAEMELAMERAHQTAAQNSLPNASGSSNRLGSGALGPSAAILEARIKHLTNRLHHTQSAMSRLQQTSAEVRRLEHAHAEDEETLRSIEKQLELLRILQTMGTRTFNLAVLQAPAAQEPAGVDGYVWLGAALLCVAGLWLGVAWAVERGARSRRDSAPTEPPQSPASTPENA